MTMEDRLDNWVQKKLPIIINDHLLQNVPVFLKNRNNFKHTETNMVKDEIYNSINGLLVKTDNLQNQINKIKGETAELKRENMCMKMTLLCMSSAICGLVGVIFFK